MARGFDIPQEAREAGEEAYEDRLRQLGCSHRVTRTVTTNVRGVWKCLDCGARLDDRATGPQSEKPNTTSEA